MSDNRGNRDLSSAKKAKQDEFYTQYVDIQKEVEAYLEFDPDAFRGKIVYCNCDGEHPIVRAQALNSPDISRATRVALITAKRTGVAIPLAVELLRAPTNSSVTYD